ncbi:MAG: SIMPL domain-containing protein [Rubricella sp.]
MNPRSFLPALALIVAAIGVCRPAFAQEAPVPSIFVSGVGEVVAVPDIARITIGVEENAPRAAAATQAVANRAAEVVAALAEAGITGADVQTRRIDLSPVYAEPQPGRAPRVAGYRASTELSIIVRDLADAGGTLDAITEAGVNRLNGFRFDIEDPSELVREARRAAVRDAFQRAGDIAEAAGIELGPVYEIREGGGGMPRPVMADMMAVRSEAVMPVEPGELTMSATVSLRIGIVQ